MRGFYLRKGKLMKKYFNGMLSDNPSAIGNLPTEPVVKKYPKSDTPIPQSYPSGLTDINKQIDKDKKNIK